MKYYYGEHDGTEFPTPDKLFSFDQLMAFILQYGEQALKAIEQMLKDPSGNPQQAEWLEKLLEEGMLDRDGKGKVRLTPRAVTRMQQKALVETFADLRNGQREGHEKVTSGHGGQRVEGTKPYAYGDDVSEIDIHQTLRNALARHGLPGAVAGANQRASSGNWQPATGNSSRPLATRVKFDERDFELHLHEGTTSCSTVVLLDMSGSMMRYGRFLAAKRVAMAMQALVRGRFPQDSLDFVGFYSGAHPIPEALLPLTMPKPVTIYDSQVHLRVPIDKLGRAPQHFTNLHMGLQLARRILRRRSSENKQVFIVTDGQPTAHVEGDAVHLIYPPDDRSTVATLKEALLAVREDIRIATFALIEDYWGMDWVGFVDQLTKLTKGIAFYTSSDQLSSCIMESYLSGRRKKTYLA